MKKLIVSILVLAVSCSCAFAETDNPLLFRGLEWEQPLNVYTEAIIAEIGNASYSKPDSMERKFLYADFNAVKVYDRATPEAYDTISFEDRIIRCSFVDSNALIADYPISSVIVYSYPSHVDGKIEVNEETAITFMASYVFDIKAIGNAASATDNLYTKLTSLYGEPDVHFQSEDAIEYYIWLGAEETYASLCIDRENGKDVSDVSIDYGKSNVRDTLESILKLSRESKSSIAGL